VASSTTVGTKDGGDPAAARTAPAGPRLQPYLDRLPRIVGTVAALLGITSLIDGLWPHKWSALWALNPILAEQTGAGASAVVAVAGLLLLRVATGLRRRKQSAWRVAVVACAGIALADLVRAERRPLEGIAAVTLFVALVSARSRFTAIADPHSQWFAVRVAAQVLTVALGYGLISLYLPHHVPPGTSFATRLQEVVWSLAGAGGVVPIHDDVYGDAFHFTLLGFGLVTVTCTLFLLLRPAEPRALLTVDDEARLRELLGRHGRRDSLGYFALRRDKSVHWSPSGKAAITYRVVCGVALVSGDPLGDPEAWPGAIAAFRQHVDRHGWTPAVMGCSELAATVFAREYGLAALELGDEAVLTADGFCLEGRAIRAVRQACTRTARAGYTVAVRRVGELDAAEIAELRTAAAAWRGGPVERGFSMALSRVGDPADGDCVVVTAHRAGNLCGLLHFVPWSDDGLSLDLMRRDRTSDNGLNELMIATLMGECRALGVERVSLNFAVFREALERGAQIGAGPAARLWRRLLLFASRWWQIESLYRFNAKFQPQWQPRYICYPAARAMPQVALAAMEAEAFIVRPRLLTRMLGRG
jgi:lysyl-tRNA synthetase class 2